MKKSISILGCVAILSSLVILSCDKRHIDAKASNLLEFEYFVKYGALHNEFLTNVKNNLQIDNGLNSHEERIDYINEFQNKFLSTCTLPDYEKVEISKELERNKDLVDFDISRKLVSDQRYRKEEDTVSVFALHEVAEKENILDTFEIRSMTQLSELARMGFEGTISD